ncbi:MAG: hypothetical protein F6J95_032770 [Leptolyngbya sp. SIO1E4]|nr:hypothetical protein [Leptolyngbya sp. SIO1E4]
MNINAIMPRAIQILFVSAGVGALLIGSPQLVQAQPGNAPAALRELDLSISQMRQLRSIMQDYQADLEEILTPEQLETLQDLREAQQDTQAPDRNTAEDLFAELDLSEAQTDQLETVQASMTQELQGVLTPEQFEQLEDTEFFEDL